MPNRRRKPFAHISDDSTGSPILDEQEQDEVIAELEQSDASNNQFFRRAFLTLPAIAIFFSFYHATCKTRSLREVLDDLGSIASCVATGYTLLFIPYRASPKPDLKGKRPVYLVDRTADDGPVRRYLAYLNGGLCIMLGLTGIVAWQRDRVDLALLRMLPILVYTVIMAVRRYLIDLDVSGLKGLRYEYKGA